MDFAIPADLQAYLDELDAFIASKIRPLEQADDSELRLEAERASRSPELI